MSATGANVGRTPSTDIRFCRLYETHHDALQRYCLRRLPVDQVNDAMAEVFLVAWRRIDVVPGGSEALPWLYGVARRTIANAMRGERRRRRLAAKLVSFLPDPAPSPETTVVQSEEGRVVSEALARLRPEDRELLMLRVWEQLSSKEIAAVLGISPAAVDMRLTRARKRFALVLAPPAPDHTIGHPRLAEGGER